MFALLLALAPLQYPGVAPVPPSVHRSADGRFELYVDPTHPRGHGPADLHLRREGERLWMRELSFTPDHVAVAADGTVVLTGDSEPGSYGGTVELRVIAPDGSVLGRQAEEKWSPSPHETVPQIDGIVLDEERGVALVRFRDRWESDPPPIPGRWREGWWEVELGSGERSAPVALRSNWLVRKGSRAWVQGIWPIPGAALLLVEASIRGAGAFRAFAVVDPGGASTWSLQEPFEESASPSVVDLRALAFSLHLRMEDAVVDFAVVVGDGVPRVERTGQRAAASALPATSPAVEPAPEVSLLETRLRPRGALALDRLQPRSHDYRDAFVAPTGEVWLLHRATGDLDAFDPFRGELTRTLSLPAEVRRDGTAVEHLAFGPDGEVVVRLAGGCVRFDGVGASRLDQPSLARATFVPGTDRRWGWRADELVLEDGGGAVLARASRLVDGGWIDREWAPVVAPDGRVAVRSGRVVAILDASGEEVASWRFPDYPEVCALSGRWLVVSLTLESGHVLDLSKGEATPFSRGPSQVPALAPGGDELWVVDPVEASLERYALPE